MSGPARLRGEKKARGGREGNGPGEKRKRGRKIKIFKCILISI
jgi:hypothetical protein